MIRRLGLAVLVAGMALAGLATGTAAAAPACADFHWIGAAGSGQRDGAGLDANGGMGDVVCSVPAIARRPARERADHHRRTRSIPRGTGPAGGWAGWRHDFMDSVDDGTDAAAEQFEAFTEQCPNTKVVLAGYSQGAMVIHRNLYDLADDPHVAAALLIADGDRLPVDTAINMDRLPPRPTRARALLRSTRSWRPPTPRCCHQRSARGPSASAMWAIRSATTTPTRPRCRPPTSRYTPRTRPP